MDKLRRDNGEQNGNEDDPFVFKNERLPSVLGEERDMYEALCRGDEEIQKISYKRAHKLHCRYITNDHAYLLIGPVKQEQVFDAPAIWLFHDVITDSQIEIMKALALPKLKRAIIRNPVTGQYIVKVIDYWKKN